MLASIIQIGNSRGIRIPKALLEESGIEVEVDIRVTRKGITITPVKKTIITDSYAATLPSLAHEWNSAEEDEAWKDL